MQKVGSICNWGRNIQKRGHSPYRQHRHKAFIKSWVMEGPTDYALNNRYVDRSATKTAWGSMVDKAKEKGIPVLLLTPTFDIPSTYEEDKLSKLRLLEEMIIEIGLKKEVGVVQVMKALNYTGNIEDLLVGVNHSFRLGHRLTANELLSWIGYR